MLGLHGSGSFRLSVARLSKKNRQEQSELRFREPAAAHLKSLIASAAVHWQDKGADYAGAAAHKEKHRLFSAPQQQTRRAFLLARPPSRCCSSTDVAWGAVALPPSCCSAVGRSSGPPPAPSPAGLPARSSNDGCTKSGTRLVPILPTTTRTWNSSDLHAVAPQRDRAGSALHQPVSSPTRAQYSMQQSCRRQEAGIVASEIAEAVPTAKCREWTDN